MYFNGWHRERDKKPSPGIQVMGWSECQQCLKKYAHSHGWMTGTNPANGPYIAIYLSNSERLPCHQREKLTETGAAFCDMHLRQDYQWIPYAPVYWKEIGSPHQHVFGKLVEFFRKISLKLRNK